jgi:photosystem II stability/assembly factor-like uncharacterized protein
MKRTIWTFFLALLAIPLMSQTVQEAIKQLEWRAIGPANMGGRVTDIDGIPGDPSTFYVSGADGGVFKTTNGGVTFEELFTDQRVYSVGALTVAPSDKNVVWLGSGEGDPRNSVGYGDGVYRSIDGGQSWEHLGLKETERIKRIVVHPDDPDVACVCALGREWGPNEERGVFRTTDGGKSWKKVLYINEDTGCSDLDMDLSNPRILYAGMWTFRRKPWRFDDGGKETAVYRSKDGGDTWEKIMKGLPEVDMARPGIQVAQSRPNTVYLITEFEGQVGSLFRSDDRGNTWNMVNDDPNINFRPFYYSDIRVDPNDHRTLYSLSGRLMKSIDGGKSFERIAQDVHGDHQSMWIDPMNSNRVLSGSDGGYQISYDAGATFDIINNVELSQYYQMDIDMLEPYNVYGGLQDNGTWVGPSNSLHSRGILKRHWKALAGGDGYYAVPIPGSEHEIYANLQGGVIFHVNRKTGNVRNIHPYPKITGSAGDAIENHKYRFNWDSPIHISPHDPNTVYFGGNVLFKSTDRGYNWEEISPDLTTNDKSKQRTSGGSIYQDNTAAEFHCSILTIAESPVEKGVIWVGTDDGNLQVTRDGGKKWTNVNKNLPGLPDFSWFAKIHASEHDAGTAFIAVDNHRNDDFVPYAYMTTNYGKSWTKIVNGLPKDDYVKVIRQDPHLENVLYLGMECGLYMSWDKGANWTRINNNLPPVSVRDLRVHPRERDLIVGTHGRGIWILDDARPLTEMMEAQKKEVHLYPVRNTTRWHMYGRIENLGQRTYVAPNPEYGAYVNFFLADQPEEEVKVEILDSEGTLVRTITEEECKEGINRIVWDLRADAGTKWEHNPGGGWRSGDWAPMVPPGEYTAILRANGQTQRSTFDVKADPRVDMTAEDYQTQYGELKRLQGLLSETHELLNNSEDVLSQLKALKERLEDIDESDSEKVMTALDKAWKEVEALKNEWTRPPPHMNYRQRPRLREEIRSLANAIDGATAKPTSSQEGRSVELKAEVEAAVEQFEKVVREEIAALNMLVKDVPPVSVKSRKP